MTMLILGWNTVTVKVLGVLAGRWCRWCGNVVSLLRVRRTSWFTLLFGPVVPYRREQVVVYPVCRRGYGLDRHSSQLPDTGGVDAALGRAYEVVW